MSLGMIRIDEVMRELERTWEAGSLPGRQDAEPAAAACARAGAPAVGLLGPQLVTTIWIINVRFGPLCGLKSDISRGPRMGWSGRASAPNGSQSAPGACQERSTTMPRASTVHAVIASPIGRLGSSAFRLSTNSSVDVAQHGLSLLFGLGTKGPGIREDEVEQSFGRPCRQCDGRFKRTYELTSSIVPRGTSFHPPGGVRQRCRT